MFTDLADANHWKAKRAEAMQGARGCKATLTDPNGFWKQTADDEPTKQAVAVWVARARRAHNIALGREPLIRNFTVSIEGRFEASGDLYAA